jgi:hypothetical protein
MQKQPKWGLVKKLASGPDGHLIRCACDDSISERKRVLCFSTFDLD